MKKISILYLLVGVGFLILLMQKIVLPLVYEVVKSDAFLVQSKDEGSQLPISNAMTDLAFLHCNNYIKEQLGQDVTITFANKPLHAWSMGNYQYVINAEANVTAANKTSTQKYACRATYDNGDNQEGVMDVENWSIIGVDGIEGL